jgi:hypothetical protein
MKSVEETFTSRLNASCEPIITWVWNPNSLSSSLSNNKVQSMEELMEIIDSIGLFVAHKHAFYEQKP